MDLLKSIWGWVNGGLVHQLITLLVLSSLFFVILLNCPIEFDRVKYISKDYIDVTESTHYILHSEMTDNGAKITLETKTYCVEVKKNEL